MNHLDAEGQTMSVQRSENFAGNMTEKPCILLLSIGYVSWLIKWANKHGNPTGKVIRLTLEPASWLIGLIFGSQNCRSLYCEHLQPKQPVY